MKQIAKISFKKLVRGLPNLAYQKSELCTPCVLGKQVRSFFKSVNQVSTNRVLQLLHIDLFEPTRTQSIGGKKYYLVKWGCGKEEYILVGDSQDPFN